MTEKKSEENKLRLMEMIEEGVDHWNENRPSERQRGQTWDLQKCIDLSGLDFSHRNLSGIDFENTNLKGTKFDGTNLSGSILIKVTADKNTSFKGATLDKSVFDSATLNCVDFENATFIEANLSNTRFYQANLKNVDLTKVIVNERTRFDYINECENCKIEKITLNNLEKKDGNIGGFYNSELKRMSIEDDFGKLKLSFSGFWTSLHLFSLSLFIFPYTFFLFKLWSISYGFNLFEPMPATTYTIGEMFWEYIYSAGALDGKFSYLSLIVFTLVLYNLCRVVLLWKTLTMEHLEEVTGLTNDYFKLNWWWGTLYKIVTFGMAINLILIFINTINFLSRPLVG